MIKLPFKSEIKLWLHKHISKQFYCLYNRNSILLRVGLLSRLRRRYAPTINEQKQDIIARHIATDPNMINDCVSELLRFERAVRMVMPPCPIPDEVLDKNG